MLIIKWRAVYSERGTYGSEGREPKPAGHKLVRRGCPYPIMFRNCWENRQFRHEPAAKARDATDRTVRISNRPDVSF